MATEQEKRQFAGDCLEWLATIPEADKDWAEAILCAALDSFPNDLGKALATAKDAFSSDPHGPQE